MNIKQNNNFGMIRTVDAVCVAKASVIAQVKAFEKSHTALKAKMGEILVTARERKLVLTGITDDKQTKKKELAILGNIVAGVVKGYANTVGDKKLAAEVNFSESGLLADKDEEILINADIIFTRATKFKIELVDYGITPELLDGFEALIGDFSDKKPAPTNAKNTKEVLTVKLDLLFDEANDILKLQMDNTGKIFKTLNTEFYDLYKASRKIINRGHRKADNGLIKGVVKNVKNEFLVDVLVQLIPENVLVLSNEKGEFEFDDLGTDKYSLKFSKEGLDNVEMKEVELKKGEEKMVEVIMNAIVA